MNSHRITDIDDIQRYVFAGNSKFTVVGRTTRYTYRVKRADPTPGKEGQEPWFVSLLTGSDNMYDYSYMGIVPPHDKLFLKATQKSVIRDGAPPFDGFSWLLRRMFFAGREPFPEHVEFWHEGVCGRCGRTLTVPESIARGIGPECAEKMGM